MWKTNAKFLQQINGKGKNTDIVQAKKKKALRCINKMQCVNLV